MRVLFCLPLLLSLACGDDDSLPDAGNLDGGTDGGETPDVGGDALAVDSGPDEDAGAPLPRSVGGDRPANVVTPRDYDPETPTPLLVLLHGYGASGALQDLYFGTTRAVRDRGWLLVLPDGTTDASGKRFWNASTACCNFGGSTVDDVAYVRGLIEEMKEHFNVDASRVYLLGHSNGGFMAYRMACDAADVITAVASLAGAAEGDETRCEPARPISVLQIHGTADATIAYTGGGFEGATFPSAQGSVEGYAARAGCSASEVTGEIDFTSDIPGDETSVRVWSGCDAGLGAELWSLEGGSHIPALADGAIERTLDWLGMHTL